MNKVNSKLLEHFDDIDELVFCTLCYYLGRKTIGTCRFSRNPAKAWDDLEEIIRKAIQKELTEAFEYDDKCRETVKDGVRFSLPLSNDCDRAAWEEARKKFN
jgi:hypothetical protein